MLTNADRDQYIQSILSTYVRSSPPDLESALSLLAEIRESDMQKAEDALKYTIFLCKADSLYDIALGMYNFPLVLMVAQQAQMVNCGPFSPYSAASTHLHCIIGSSWIPPLPSRITKSRQVLSALQDWWPFETTWKGFAQLGPCWW